ncbi:MULTISPECIES: ABC transporter substrate-binding protein [Nocardioides]|uniref:ABC transporter substrate-binding protein n=1 Tax=Nocardioides TaxID=1839 RepID=UPI000702F961|nr:MULTISPECIES: sugar ABC transporter substrate-binding protein [unclassified Nocardioides]KQP64142.1 sugar ABC transporter substrate-binding protein [Nocardioides sp. Leaf285]KQQ43168.1 sugar ABC transporter substrate-binding protein [Nocardioides sp. Leaf307]
MKNTNRRNRWLGAVAVAAVGALSLSACGSGDDSASGGEQVSADAVDAALEEGGTLTVWAWEPTLEKVVSDFEAEYPNVDVELVNAGTGNDQYTALQNAVSAGKGVPDVAQVEYYALPQFSLAGSVSELSGFGAADLEDTFTPGPWSSVQQNDGIYGLPMDSGPMAMFYNQEVFEEYGIEVPTTWEEFMQAGRDLQAADPDVYITNDTGDAGFATSLMWQAGAQPFASEGEDVTIEFSDEGAQTYADTWQTMIDEELLAPISSWSDEWFSGLNDGTVATLVTGAWMPANLESGAPDGKGDWRVAPMPQWEAGAETTAENGGSSLTIPTDAQEKELAYAFLEYANVEDGVQTRVDGGAFPATVAEIESDEFVGKEFPYFGDQKVNEVLSESAGQVAEGWSYLPFQVYANSIFNDTVGQAYVSDEPLADGLAAWQEQMTEYGEQQGFSVS